MLCIRVEPRTSSGEGALCADSSLRSDSAGFSNCICMCQAIGSAALSMPGNQLDVDAANLREDVVIVNIDQLLVKPGARRPVRGRHGGDRTLLETYAPSGVDTVNFNDYGSTHTDLPNDGPVPS